MIYIAKWERYHHIINQERTAGYYDHSGRWFYYGYGDSREKFPSAFGLQFLDLNPETEEMLYIIPFSGIIELIALGLTYTIK